MLQTRFLMPSALLVTLCTTVDAAWTDELTQQELAEVGVADRFFRAVETEKVDRLLGIFHPALREKVDAPVLESWMQRLNEKLGGYRKLSWSKFERGIKWVDGIKIQNVGGKYLFENGEVDAEFEYAADQLTRFNVNSDLLDDDWHQYPSDEALYVERAERFLVAFLNDDLQTAFDLMHPKLQEIVPLDKLRAMRDKVRSDIERLESIEHVRSVPNDEDLYRLTLYFRLKPEQREASEDRPEQIAEVSFDFLGLRGNLLAFDLRADGEFPGEGDPAAITQFLRSVGRGDAEGATHVMHPNLQRTIDPPLFQAWVEAVGAVLGEFTELDEEQLVMRTAYESGNEVVKVDGKASFTDGTAEITSSSYQGQLLAFKVNTDLMAKDWFQGVSNTRFYEQRTEDFLRRWLKGEPDRAYKMLHENLRKKVSLAQFEDGVAQLKRQFGELSSISIGDQVESTSQGVIVPATIVFDSQTTASANVEYAFDGLKGHLLRFRLSPGTQ